MKNEMIQARIVATVVLALLWPVSAYAATLTLGAQMAQTPMLDLLMTLVLSILSGTTALLHAMIEQYKQTDTIPRLPLFVASKMLGSVLAGLLMFFGAGARGWDPGTQAGAIILASFGGTWFIQRVLQWAVNKFAPEAKP